MSDKPNAAEQRREHWAHIKAIQWPRPGTFLRQGNQPRPPKHIASSHQKRVMRDSTKAKRARRDREAMTS